VLNPHMFRRKHDGIEHSNEDWNKIPITQEICFDWKEASTYIQEVPFFRDMSEKSNRVEPIINARVLVMLGNGITTDHISPAGSIDVDSPAGRYLMGKGVVPEDFNSYGSRRGNHQVMIRGTFANIRLKNLLANGKEGGWTTHLPTGEITSIYEAAMRYGETGTPAIVLAGRDYGMGSSRDWAAKGTRLLGIKAVIAESFERIHRSNLICMGVLPLQFKEGQSSSGLCLTGRETYTIHIDDMLQANQEVCVEIKDEDKNTRDITVLCRLDTPVEIEYYRNGGILQTVLRLFLKENEKTSL